MKKNLLLLFALIFGCGGIFLLSNLLETGKQKINENFADEDLYFSPNLLKAVGYDFRGLIADWYWINSLQYLGNKIVNSKQQININDLHPVNPRLFYPMLDTAATLDPQFMALYSYGASILPAIDNQAAVKFLEKGIAANPDEWRLYHNLGYIYWQMKDYQKASETYAKGAEKPGAPAWMEHMSASIQAQGASRDFALEIYRQMYETAGDEQTRNFAGLRYMQIISLNERDLMRPVFENFQKQTGRCPNDWREISAQIKALKSANGKSLQLNQNAAPLDPSGVPYRISNRDGKCEADLDFGSSKIPYQ